MPLPREQTWKSCGAPSLQLSENRTGAGNPPADTIFMELQPSHHFPSNPNPVATQINGSGTEATLFFGLKSKTELYFSVLLVFGKNLISSGKRETSSCPLPTRVR
jgi:hypothetical protein